ncbi:hypothetical protein F5B20DRAFT_480868 [Whalleya microplaca]|nr:hypothetical protein F5B20DRAFT_480868 [Whalleya microplaca]
MMTCLLLLALSFGILLNLTIVEGATTILTFSDLNCTSFRQTLQGADGFPDGDCTNFEDQVATPYSSFMINTVDSGCGVTIYGKNINELSCSSDIKILARQGVCYNSTWQYYSVDSCTSLVPTSSIPSNLPSTITPTPTTAVPSPSPPPNGVNVAAIASGAAVGGLVLAIIIATMAYFFWWRPKMREQRAQDDLNSGRDEELKNITVAEQRWPVEAPWQSERPHEMSPDHIVEAPDQPRLHEMLA